jgi:hypothetical protein
MFTEQRLRDNLKRMLEQSGLLPTINARFQTDYSIANKYWQYTDKSLYNDYPPTISGENVFYNILNNNPTKYTYTQTGEKIVYSYTVTETECVFIVTPTEMWFYTE